MGEKRVAGKVALSNAILYLVAESGRYVTGVAHPVDAGFLVK